MHYIKDTEDGTLIRNDEMLNQVQHDNVGQFSVTLNSFQGLMNTYISVFELRIMDLTNTTYCALN